MRRSRWPNARDRFVASFEISGDCWKWIGGKTEKGYGSIFVDGKNLRAHRFSYQMHHGPIPHGMFVCHTCDNPSCVNPAHLFLGTHQANTDDKVSKGRQARGACFGNHSKLSSDDVIFIRNSRASNRKLAKQLGVSAQHIGHIRMGRSWKHLIGRGAE